MHGEQKYEVVISGLSGQYPECEDVEELWTRLMKKEDMVTIDERRFNPGDFDVPAGIGKLRHPEHFDMTFFGVHRKLVEKMDPFGRLLLEQAYRAVCDAGVNPKDLEGTSTAVIMSSSVSEPELELAGGSTGKNVGAYSILALSRTMQANRLSYFMNLKGPSYQLDDTSCGGIQAIQYACDLISTGICTAAIVGSCALLYRGESSFHYQMMGRLSNDSKTRSFSSDASGYARSEGCVTVFLQRKDHAKRIYGTVLGTNTLCHGNKNVEFPAFPKQLYDKFLVETYKNANVNPKDLVYVEAYGSASKTLDALELNGLSKALVKQRSKPLLIGSIKSNLGHAEGASSMVSLTKVLMALDRGIIPPNINYFEPNPDVPDLVSGKLKVVTEPTPITGGTMAMSEFGMTGNCAHIIVKGNEKTKINETAKETKLPYLVTMSARNESSLKKTLKNLEKREIDEEFVLLINSLYKEGIKNHVYRGYSVITGEPNKYNVIGPAPAGDRKPIWFMYSGMGSQWPTMAKSLMALPIFADSILKSHKVLEPKGINLLDIVCKDDPTIFDNILNSFVGIAAVQIGLTDVLKSIGVEPDGIIGHSVGELGCAYADGCMTAEQMILAAHARGRASSEATLIKGMMAAVGAGYNQIKDSLPETIEVACHNSKDSCTLSGPAEDMKVFIDELKAKGMFAKLVNAANIAYHSRYIQPAAPTLLNYLKEIIPVPVKRSPKWVSSSNPESNWDTHLSQHSSAEYHTNNLLSSVLFEEASSHIPSNAIVIEIAPHGLLQAIVKRSLSQAVHIPLTNRMDQDNLLFLLGSIGKLYMAGIPVELQALYPTAKFPVSRGTPGISALIDWSRDENFPITQRLNDPLTPFCRVVSVDQLIEDSEEKLINVINGKSVISSSSYFNEMIGQCTSVGSNESTPIVMENIKFLGYTEFHPSSSTELRFQLLKGRGNIVVSNNATNEILLEGTIKSTDPESVKGLTAPDAKVDDIRGISRADMLRFMKGFGIERDQSSISLDNVIVGNEYFLGTARWEGDIGKFLMSLLSLIEFIESKSSYVLKLFYSAGEILINLPFLNQSEPQDFVVEYDLLNKKLQCEGVRIARVECRNPGLSKKVDKDYVFTFELPQFMPYINNRSLSRAECVNTCLQLILENIYLTDGNTVKIIEIGINPELHDALVDISESAKYTGQTSLTAYTSDVEFLKKSPSTLLQDDLWVVCAEPPSPDTLKAIASIKNGFVLCPKGKNGLLEKNCRVVYETLVHGKTYTLHAIQKLNMRQYKVVKLDNGYLPQLENQLLLAAGSNNKDEDVKTVILWGQVDSMVTVDQILEQTKDLPNNQLLHYWLFHDEVPDVNFSSTEFKSQFERDVRMNISKDRKWGSLRLMPSNVREGPFDSSKPSKFYYPLSAVAESRNLLALGLSIDYSSEDTSVSNLGAYDYVSTNKNMGIGTYDQTTKSFTPDKTLSWRKPNQWTSKEAATIPVLYSLASYILHHINKTDEFAEENTILVNRALLPLSQAVISLALFENKNVHATVYCEKEKQTLLTLFPKLNPKNIYDCSTVSFFVDVLNNTSGGVYKVINTFDDPIMIGPCAKCTLPFGVLIYANQALMNKGAAMGMLRFDYDIIARGISEDILINSSEDVKLEIKGHIAKALQGGGVVPIRATSTMPSSTINTEAVEYLKSNSNKVVVEIDDSENNAFLQGDSKIQVIVEGKIQVDLSLDIIEWLLKRGSRKIILFSRQSRPLEANSLRLQSLRDQYKCAIIDVRPSNQLSTKPQVEKFIKESNNSSSGPAMVFFLGSGLKERMEIFDEILSVEYPASNMICIGKEGENVCERRKKNSLPALYIRCSTDNIEGVNLVHYFESLINDSPNTPVVFVKKYAVQNKPLHELMANLTYVPDSKDDLVNFMSQSKVSTKATFVEISSDGPRAQHNRDIYPMFLIPGLRPNRLHRMASQLFCPTMEARIPASASSIEQIATDLASQLLALPHNMFTLCAEGWGGILALHVAAKLKAKDKYVNLILLDGTPASVMKWADNLLKNGEVLIKKYLQIPPGVESNLKNSSWDEELKFAIEHSPLREEHEKTLAINCLNVLRERLQNAVDAKLPSKKLKIKCHVFELLSHAHEDHGLGEYLLEEPTLHTKDSKTADDMIDTAVANEVNPLLLYEYTDAANPPIDKYLGCHVVDRNLPHWGTSSLVRLRE